MELLSVGEVAKRLQVSESLVYALVEKGKLVAHRIGLGRGVIRVALADLNAYLESCRVEKQERKPAAPRPVLKHLRL